MHQRRPESRATFTFRVRKLEQLSTAYGAASTQKILGEVLKDISDKVAGDGQVLSGADNRINVVLTNFDALGCGDAHLLCARFADDVVSAVARRPFRFAGEVIHVALEGDWKITPSEVGGKARECAEASIEAHDRGPCVAQAFRSDMRGAADLLAALEDDRVSFAWQPVRHGGAVSSVLYYEALLRRIENGTVSSASGAIEGLERIGLIRVLDCHAVKSVVGELFIDPTVSLAVNISAQSARLDSEWTEILDVLSRRRDVARRLIVEITESAPIADISQSCAFVSMLQRLGVRVALDDFGAGYASIRQLLALRPDIVKIDALFARRAALSDKAREAYVHIVGLARSLAPIVIAEGIESSSDERLARDIGAEWQQGYYHGSPSSSRPWRFERSSRRVPYDMSKRAST